MRWTLKPQPESQTVQQLAEALHVNTLVAMLLVQRGINTYEEARCFFRPSLKELHDPYLMKDMNHAVDRIQKAIANHENILVYGDYDVDGTTAVALVSSYLSIHHSNVATYIPDRYTEGYGISYQGIDFAADHDFSLIIALDCGIKAIDQVQYAAERGIDFIICDHHLPGSEIPDAVAILDPKREDCTYPYDALCGCGIGFKLIQALAGVHDQNIDALIPYLDLVVTAIAADIVPITGENRILAFYGLQLINTTPRPGIKALIHQVKKKKLSITDVVFIIAPRINAAGRIKHGKHAVDLLTENDLNRAIDLASNIETFNTDRKHLDQQITEEALMQIRETGEENKCATVVYQPDWHKGVIGIVASRLTETYYRPTVVFTKSGDVLAASARSVKHFDIYHALEACTDYMIQFGGHKYAAGITLSEDQYPTFKEKFEAVVTATIDKRLLIPEIEADALIPFSEITPKLYRILQQFAPFGPGNMRPIFISRDLEDTGYGKQVGEDGKHLKITMHQYNTSTIGGIGFGLGRKHSLITKGKSFMAIYTIDENEWQGKRSLQLKLRDIKA